MKAKVMFLSSLIAALFAVSFLPAAFGASGQIVCLSPTSCANNQTLSLTGPGSTATATMKLTSNLAGGTTVNFYVCDQGAASCTSPNGAFNGWSWTFTASGVTDGSGTVTGLTLSITAPSVVTTTNNVETVTIFACAQTGTNPFCDSIQLQVASLSVTASVPEFGLGMGIALAIGLIGLMVVVRKRNLSVPSPYTL